MDWYVTGGAVARARASSPGSLAAPRRFGRSRSASDARGSARHGALRATSRSCSTRVDSSGRPAAGSIATRLCESSGVLRRVYVRVGDRVSAGEALGRARSSQPLALAARGAQADARAADAAAAAAAVDRYQQRARGRSKRGRARRTALSRRRRGTQRRGRCARHARYRFGRRAKCGRTTNAPRKRRRPALPHKAALAQNDLDRATLRSPSDGIVTAILHRAGEPVDPGTPVVVVGPNIKTRRRCAFPRRDAAQIEIGDAVDLAITGLHGPRPRARHRRRAALDPTTQTATVIVAGLPADASAGAAVRARITVARVAGCWFRRSRSSPIRRPATTSCSCNSVKKTARSNSRKSWSVHEDGSTALIGAGLAGERIAAQGAFELLAPAGGGD